MAEVEDFFKGLVNASEAQSIPRGSASDSLNWVTSGDKIELRRGSVLLGTEIAGTGKVWVHVAQGADGSEVAYRKRGRKLEYFDEALATPDWVECGTDMFPAIAVDDEPSFTNYNALAGAQMFVSSPNSSIYKVMVANPGSYTDLIQTTFRGKIRAKSGRMFLWQRQDSTGNKDLTGLYGSYIDKDETSDYTQISAEAIGLAGSLTYTNTLAFKAAGAKRTCFGVTVTDGTETFVDNYDGTLTGSAGGSGTINYTSGAYSVTFAVAAAGAVTATYYWEDCTNAGIVDFTKSTPRTAGQGFILRQDDGGGMLQTVMGFQDVEYCLHERKTWALALTNTDTAATNLPYRNKVGIPNHRAAVETGDGIYYVDDTDQNGTAIRVLALRFGSTEVVPKDISINLDLEDLRFDMAVAIEWGTKIAFACRTSASAENNRLLVLDRSLRTKDTAGAWDLHEFFASSLAVYNGTLIAGDSVSNNVYELFSELSDDDAHIANHWKGNLDNLNLRAMKKSKRFLLQGEIGPDQELVVSMAVDKNPFVEVGRIRGDGSYVDRSQQIHVGATSLGRTELGGGTSGGIVAYNYEREFKLQMDKFEQVQLKFTTLAIGFVSVSRYEFKDIRRKTSKAPAKYRGS